MKKKVVIIYDYVDEKISNPDRIDTLNQVDFVECELLNLGFITKKIAVTSNLIEFINKIKETEFDFIFNLIESFDNSGYLSYVPLTILDLIGVKYTGGSAKAIFNTTDKVLAKQMMLKAGIKTPAYVTLSDSYGEISHNKYIIKAITEDGSVGLEGEYIVKTDNTEELRQIIKSKSELLRMNFFAEAFIEGREFQVSILGNMGKPDFLPIAEIIFKNHNQNHKVIDYNTKWNEYKNLMRKFDFDKQDEKLIEKLKSISLKCWEYFELKGYARIDFRVDNQGEPMVIEINSNPCLSIGGGFELAASNRAMKHSELISKIISEL